MTALWHPDNKHQPRRGDVLGNWQKLELLVIQFVEGEGKGQYGAVMGGLRQDTGGLLGFERAPAAQMNHHSYEGGLVYHLLEMWDTWLWLKPIAYAEGHTDNNNIVQAVINHDLHKAHRTFQMLSRSPWRTKYSKDHTDMNLPNRAKSMWLLNRYGVSLSEGQMNTLCWSEGGFAPDWPKWHSVLAKLAYLLDELSGNVRSRIESGDLEVAAGQKYRTLKYG